MRSQIRFNGKRRRILALACAAPLLVVAALAAVVVVWCVWQRAREPRSALERDVGPLVVLHESRDVLLTSVGERRVLREITFRSAREESIQIAISLPEDEHGRIPVLLILGGLTKGREALEYVPSHGRNALISYSYPYDESAWYENTRLFEIAAIQKAVLIVPAQIEALGQWVQRQAWADTERLNILGYSFGALFVPAIQSLSQAHGISYATTVMAFGGVDIEALLRKNLRTQPLWLRDVMAWLAASAIHPVEPALHLPHLDGRFLLINGENDEKVPFECSLRMQDLTPEPKTVINLSTTHLHPRREELTIRIIEITEQWLLESGMINPL